MSGTYRTLRVSMDTVPDLVRALHLARRANEREGICPARPEAAELEAFGRIIREWSLVAIHAGPIDDDFVTLGRADWSCSECSSSSLGSGGLVVQVGRVLCHPCALQATQSAPGHNPASPTHGG